MRTNRTLLYTLLAFLAIAPLVLVPFLGARFIGALSASEEQEEALIPIEGDPVRLVTIPLMGSGRMANALVAVIDLAARDHATYLCQNSQYLNNELIMFADTHPSRIDPEARVPGRDPQLAAVLRQAFPTIQIDAVHLLEPTTYGALYPPREVFECQGQSYGRIARPSEAIE